jgi:hypothetical protein
MYSFSARSFSATTSVWCALPSSSASVWTNLAALRERAAGRNQQPWFFGTDSQRLVQLERERLASRMSSGSSSRVKVSPDPVESVLATELMAMPLIIPHADSERAAIAMRIRRQKTD